MNPETLTIAEARRALDAKEYSALDLTNAYLENIAARDGEIHAYLEVWADSAREEAKHADAMIAAGKSQFLTGIPIAVKDNILIEGRIAGAASKILENYHASYDATVIEKLKAQGAVFLGRTNMDEFAMGSSTENSAYGPTRNPIDTKRVPGGSSGGSAAAVAAHMALAALGSDTGGSIRQPAAHCGLVGFKPTYGAVSRFGLIAMGSSLDQIGPLTKSISDAKILYDVIRGYDKNDSTSLPETAPTPAKTPRMIGVPRAFLKSGIDEDVLATFEATLKKLESAGFEIRDIEMPSLPYGLAVYYVIMPAEVSTSPASMAFATGSQCLPIPSERFTRKLEQLDSAPKRAGAFLLARSYFPPVTPTHIIEKHVPSDPASLRNFRGRSRALMQLRYPQLPLPRL